MVNNRAERALIDAGAAVDALVIINLGLLLIVDAHSSNLTAALARTDIFGDRAIRAGIRTAAAVNALFRVDLRPTVVVL